MSQETITIPLSRGLFATIDVEDFPLVSQMKWHAVRASRKNGFAYYAGGRRSRSGPYIYMHRLIARTAQGQQTDHRNNDGLDNRRENLRTCTRQQNQRNKACYSRIGFKGVRFNNSRFCARIVINRKSIHLGVFDSVVGAAKAYDSAAIKLFGEFARLNFPTS